MKMTKYRETKKVSTTIKTNHNMRNKINQKKEM